MKAQPLLPAPLKRRRGPRVAVLALVLCSLLVPLAFLFDRAPSGTYPTLPRSLAHWVGTRERGGRRARITASPPVDLGRQLPPVVGRSRPC
jgi:alpha-1,4-galacturonosyltransferase